MYRNTVSETVILQGIGLHTGRTAQLRIYPATPGTGIRFLRTDLMQSGTPRHEAEIPALYTEICDTLLGTTLKNRYGAKIATVEHLMAALWGAGVDDALIEIDGPEVPILDGSSQPFMDAIADSGLVTSSVLRQPIRIGKRITVTDGETKAVLTPGKGFRLSIEIDYPHPALGNQKAVYDFTQSSFTHLANSRTFGFADEVAKLKSMGLAQGGSLENAIVIGESGVINEEGLRHPDECLRHKALDCVGDLFLAGGRIEGHISVYRPGHTLNAKILRTLFAAQSPLEQAQAPFSLPTEALPALCEA